MAGNNEESQTGPHRTPRAHMNLENPMASLRERPEALRPTNGNGHPSHVDETNPPTATDLTNLVLLELLQKQGV